MLDRRVYVLCILILALLVPDLIARVWLEYIPAYHLQNYVTEQYDNFNTTAERIIRITNTTENLINNFKNFFENKFLKSVCSTTAGQAIFGVLCTPFQKRTLTESDFEAFFSDIQNILSNKTHPTTLLLTAIFNYDQSRESYVCFGSNGNPNRSNLF